MTHDESATPAAADGPSRRRAIGMAGAALATVALGGAALAAGPAAAAEPAGQPSRRPVAARAPEAECLADLNG